MEYKIGSQVSFKIKGNTYIGIIKNYYVSFNHIDNDIIFKLLDISDKETFCDKYYGYESERDCDWPEYKFRDIAAVTRVINALQAMIKGESIEQYKIYG